MFLPIGDFPNPPKPQWMTRILIGINVAIHLLVTMPLEQKRLEPEDLRDPEKLAAIKQIATYAADTKIRDQVIALLDRPDIPAEQTILSTWLATIPRDLLLAQQYGYSPAAPSLLGLFCCMFLHGGFLHLFGNMLYLWIFGDNVEYRLGRVGYLVAYLGTGVVATLAFALPNTGSLVPLVGASGAISGVLGFYLLWFPHNQVRVVILFFFITLVHVRAIWVLGFYLVIDNLLPIYLQRGSGSGGGVAYAAHLGGFVAGLGGAWALNAIRGAVPAPRPTERSPVPQSMRAPEAVLVEDPAELFDRAARANRMEDAAHAFARLAREGGGTPAPEPVFALARWLYENDFTPDAAAVFRFYVKHYPRGADLDRVHLGLGILLARRLGEPAAAREHLLQAIDLAGEGSAIADTAREQLRAL